MTLPELITEILGAIQRQFYDEAPADFHRDRQALQKAVLTYGVECERRGWHFDTKFILHDILKLLKQLTRQERKGWLPVYLQGAVVRSIGLRAEALQAEAQRQRVDVTRLVNRTLGRVKPCTLDPARSDVEVMALMRRAMSAERKARRAAARPAPARQKELL